MNDHSVCVNGFALKFVNGGGKPQLEGILVSGIFAHFDHPLLRVHTDHAILAHLSKDEFGAIGDGRTVILGHHHATAPLQPQRPVVQGHFGSRHHVAKVPLVQFVDPIAGRRHGPLRLGQEGTVQVVHDRKVVADESKEGRLLAAIDQGTEPTDQVVVLGHEPLALAQREVVHGPGRPLERHVEQVEGGVDRTQLVGVAQTHHQQGVVRAIQEVANHPVEEPGGDHGDFVDDHEVGVAFTMQFVDEGPTLLDRGEEVRFVLELLFERLVDGVAVIEFHRRMEGLAADRLSALGREAHLQQVHVPDVLQGGADHITLARAGSARHDHQPLGGSLAPLLHEPDKSALTQSKGMFVEPGQIQLKWGGFTLHGCPFCTMKPITLVMTTAQSRCEYTLLGCERLPPSYLVDLYALYVGRATPQPPAVVSSMVSLVVEKVVAPSQWLDCILWSHYRREGKTECLELFVRRGGSQSEHLYAVGKSGTLLMGKGEPLEIHRETVQLLMGESKTGCSNPKVIWIDEPKCETL